MDDTDRQMLDQTVSIHEAARRFGVSDKTIRRWIKTGKLPASQESGPYGVAWRIPETAIHTAQQIVEVIPVDRALDPRTLGMVIAQAVSQETQGLIEAVNALKAQVEQLSQTIELLEERRTQTVAHSTRFGGSGRSPDAHDIAKQCLSAPLGCLFRYGNLSI